VNNIYKALSLSFLHALNVICANDISLLMLFLAAVRPTTTTTSRPPFTCPSGQSPCRTAGQCVPWSAICDGRVDCQDFSDESDCGEFS